MSPRTEPAPTSPERVDTRLFASAALPRLLLLVVFVVTSVVTLMPGHALLSAAFGDPLNDTLACQYAAGFDPGGTFGANQATLGGTNSRALADCLARFGLPWWGPLATVLLVLALAALLWWVMPLVTRRRARLRPVGDDDIRVRLADMVTTAGLTRAPTFRVEPTGQVTARTFGRPGAYTVALGSGLLVAPEPVRRAVVLHELAHLRNRDVGITLATIALWRVFAVVMLAPYLFHSADLVVGGLFYGPASTKSDAYFTAGTAPGAQDVVTGLVTAALVFLTRVDIMRSREFHADHLAVGWGADRTLWTAAAGATGRTSLRSLLRGLSGTHPSWARRRAALVDPRPLYRPGAFPTLLSGIAAMLVAAALRYSDNPVFLVDWVGIALAAVLAAGIAGVALWRTGGRDTDHGRTQGLRTGLWLGAGLAAGSLVADQPMTPAEWLPPSPLPIVLISGFAVAVTVWTADALRAGSDRRAGRFPAAAILVVGVYAALLAFALRWYGHVADLLWPSLVQPLIESGYQAAGIGHGAAATVILFAIVLASTDDVLVWVPATAAWVLSLVLVATSARAPVPTPWRRAAARAATGAMVSTAGCATVATVGASLVPDDAAVYLLLLAGAASLGPLVAAATAASAGAVPGLAAGGLCAAATGVLLTALAVIAPAVGIDLAPYPNLAGGLARIVVGYLVFVMLMVVAAVAAVAAWRRTPDAVAPSAPPEPVRSSPRRRLPMVTAVVATVLLLVVTAGVTTAPRTTDVEEASSGTTQPVRDPIVLRAQVFSWLKLGGLDLQHEWLASQEDIGAGLDAILADMSDLDPLRRACARAGHVAGSARAYFRVPEPAHQAAWVAFADHAEHGAALCEQALRGDGDQAVLTDAINELDNAGREYNALSDWMSAVLEGGG